MQMGIGRTQHRRPPLKRPAGVPLPDSRRQNKANTSHAQAMRTAEAWGLRGGRLAPARPQRPDPPQAPSRVGATGSRRAGVQAVAGRP